MPIDRPDSSSQPGPPAVRERRSRLRIDALGQIAAHSLWRLRPLHLRELSESGFSLESAGPFEYGVVHKFRIGVDGTWTSVIVQARARHCSLTAVSGDMTIYLTGFEIVPGSEATMSEVRALVRFAGEMWEAEP